MPKLFPPQGTALAVTITWNSPQSYLHGSVLLLVLAQKSSEMPSSNAIHYTSYFLALIYLLLTTLPPGDIINLFMAPFTPVPSNPHIVNHEGRVLQFLFTRLFPPMPNIVPSGQ